mmetsp:Transcript_1663/g.3130  ORF Transcript_1663/g.3130 Transcript_1663/m.3130 type:complete len:92 (-) Transcript_1663:369-644(-)
MAYNTYGNGTAHYSLRSSAWPLHVWRKRAREKPKLIVFVISKKRLRLASPVLSRLRLQRSDIDLRLVNLILAGGPLLVPAEVFELVIEDGT